MRGIYIVFFIVIPLLSCTKWEPEKKWVTDLIDNTEVVFDSLMIHDPYFSESIKKSNIEKEELIEIFEAYKPDFQIISAEEVYNFDDSLLLKIRVDANNDKNRINFYFKQEKEKWVFHFFQSEDIHLEMPSDSL